MITTQTERDRNNLDPSWRGLYKTGGISGILTGALLIISMVLLFTTPQAPSSGAEGCLP